MADDSYKTIKQVAEGYYTEKRSRFISYAINQSGILVLDTSSRYARKSFMISSISSMK